MKNYKNVILKRSKSKAGAFTTIAIYPNGESRVFSNIKEAKQQILFESQKNLI